MIMGHIFRCEFTDFFYRSLLLPLEHFYILESNVRKVRGTMLKLLEHIYFRSISDVRILNFQILFSILYCGKSAQTFQNQK